MIRSHADYPDYVKLEIDGTVADQITYLEWMALFNETTPTITSKNAILSNDSLARYYRLNLLDRWYGVNGSRKAVGMRFTYNFGIPLIGFNNSDIESGKQESEIEDFTIDAYAKLLKDLFNDGGDDVHVLYSGGGILFDEVLNIFILDALKVVVGFVLVFFYMWFHLQSMALAALGILEIGKDGFVSLFVYLMVFFKD